MSKTSINFNLFYRPSQLRWWISCNYLSVFERRSKTPLPRAAVIPSANNSAMTHCTCDCVPVYDYWSKEKPFQESMWYYRLENESSKFSFSFPLKQASNFYSCHFAVFTTFFALQGVHTYLCSRYMLFLQLTNFFCSSLTRTTFQAIRSQFLWIFSNFHFHVERCGLHTVYSTFRSLW